MNQAQYQQNMLNQSMNSSVNSASTAPQHADSDYARKYYAEIHTMFTSHEFKNSDRQNKKELVGNTIYKHVEKIVGDSKAPKITGMLIDLPEAELNFSISQWAHFENKVMSAYHLITQSEPNNTAQA
jgi:extradiol dioxygenase family protein